MIGRELFEEKKEGKVISKIQSEKVFDEESFVWKRLHEKSPNKVCLIFNPGITYDIMDYNKQSLQSESIVRKLRVCRKTFLTFLSKAWPWMDKRVQALAAWTLESG